MYLFTRIADIKGAVLGAANTVTNKDFLGKQQTPVKEINRMQELAGIKNK